MSAFTPKRFTAFLNENMTVRQAIEVFDVHKYTVIPVIDDDGHYVGTVSAGDLLRHMKNVLHFDFKEAEKTPVKDVEKYRSYQTLKVDSLLPEFFALSLEQNFVPVIDDQGTYIGIITRKEIIKFLSNKIKMTI